MRTVTRFPHSVQTLEHTFIPMPDGTRLAARVWIPDIAKQHPVPAILEYIPYRKRDLKRKRDNLVHGYLAGQGYVCVRVDLRGSGDSEGIIQDQYRQQELEDALAVLTWMAAQPWCDGNTGMMGISWGGFNALQVASLRPPELKAIITVCSTDDLYVDNMHYMGGCLLTDNLAEASTMFSFNSCPPDPDLVGASWRDMWMERLENCGPWLDTWLKHQRQDDYWKHGSICEDYDSIQCPVFAVGGWTDGFTDAIFRLMENLKVPRKGLIGPWSHNYPHLAVPGPAIDFLGECLRWWDRWLKGKDTGVEQEPMLRAWMQDSVPPTTSYDHRPGRWVAEPTWPSSAIRWASYPLSGRHIEMGDEGDGENVEEKELKIESPLGVGLFAGKWCSYAVTPDLPGDQREEDGGCLVFDSPALAEEVEILGEPEVELELAANRPLGMVAVRLSDIAPHGAATRVTYGLLNLAHRNGHRHPEPLEPGKRYRVRVQMNGAAQTFPQGHRIRLALSTSYWPLVWLPPQHVQLSVFTGRSRLKLPLRSPRKEDEDLRPLGEPQAAAPPEITVLRPGESDWKVTRHLAENRSTLEVIKDEGVYRIEEIDLEVANRVQETHTAVAEDFNSIRAETLCERGFARGSWKVRTVAHTILTSSATHFRICAALDAYEEGFRVFCRSWDSRIPRDHV
jgi:putative CocE/NonD family hydrolase